MESIDKVFLKILTEKLHYNSQYDLQHKQHNFRHASGKVLVCSFLLLIFSALPAASEANGGFPLEKVENINFFESGNLSIISDEAYIVEHPLNFTLVFKNPANKTLKVCDRITYNITHQESGGNGGDVFAAGGEVYLSNGNTSTGYMIIPKQSEMFVEFLPHANLSDKGKYNITISMCGKKRADKVFVMSGDMTLMRAIIGSFAVMIMLGGIYLLMKRRDLGGM